MSWLPSMLKGVLVSLLKDGASWLFKKVTGYFKRKKRIQQTQDAAGKVEDAKTPDDIRDAADNLP